VLLELFLGDTTKRKMSMPTDNACLVRRRIDYRCCCNFPARPSQYAKSRFKAAIGTRKIGLLGQHYIVSYLKEIDDFPE
jgi:hypothetical protein